MIRSVRYVFLMLMGSIAWMSTSAQQDAWAGEWIYTSSDNMGNNFSFHLNIALPEKNMLYPALITIESGTQKWSYTLLLAKKNIRKMAIGHRYYDYENTVQPKLLKNFAGYLDLHRDLKGAPEISLQRLVSSKPASEDFDRAEAFAFKEISRDAYDFRKISSTPWQNPYTEIILRSNLDSLYYGIHDTLVVNDRRVSTSFNFGKKSGDGILSAVINGNLMADQIALTVARPEEDIRLDTGLNVLVLFTDQFGRTPASTGKLGIKTERGDRFLDHSDKKDAEASFIALRIFYEPKEPPLEENALLREYYERLNSPDNITLHPELLNGGNANNSINTPAHKFPEAIMLARQNTELGTVSIKIKKITIAIWDDAVEDGDTISLRINNKWIVQHMAVKKKPQFLTVEVDPGPNKISFIAENLGAIVPNTAVLEINDGRQRKAFFIDTDFERNNSVNIIYDPRQ